MATEFLNEKTYVDQAEKVLDKLTQKFEKNGKWITPQIVTTSKIRNILSMAADIYDNVLQNRADELNEEIVSRIEYLRVRMIYECGREPRVKDFVNAADLLDYIKMIGNDKKKYILFYHYLEALVAFHKYKGGKEN